MKILTLENKAFSLTNMPDELEEEVQFAVLDNSDAKEPDFFFIPLILILPNYLAELGVWIAFPIADVLATLVTGYFLRKEIRNTLSV